MPLSYSKMTGALQQRKHRNAGKQNGPSTPILDPTRKKRLSRSDPMVLHPDPFIHHPNPLGCHPFGKNHPTFDLAAIRRYQPPPVKPYTHRTPSYRMDLGRLHSSNTLPGQIAHGSPRVGVDDSVINSTAKQMPVRDKQPSSRAHLRRSFTGPLSLLDRTIAVANRCQASLAKVPLTNRCIFYS